MGLQADPEADDILSEFEALIRQARQLERKQQLEPQTQGVWRPFMNRPGTGNSFSCKFARIRPR